MKYAKYILSLFVLIFAVSCTIDDEIVNKGNGNKMQIVSRFVPFDQCDVTTRAASEDALKSLDYFIVADLADDIVGNYVVVFYRHSENQIITLDRAEDFKDILSGDVEENLETMQKCRIVLVANYPAIYQKIQDEWIANKTNYATIDNYIAEAVLYKGVGDDKYKLATDFTDIPYNVPALVGVPETGLPRMGDYSEEVDFSGTTTYEPGKTFEVKLQSLYSKMVFDISVVPTQTGINDNCNTFTFKGYEVHNLINELDMVAGDGNGKTISAQDKNNGHTDVTTKDGKSLIHSEAIPGDLTGYSSSGHNTVFYCYLPERYRAANIPAEQYKYPFRKGNEVGGVDWVNDQGPIRQQDANLRQRYKPLLVRESGNAEASTDATFVRFMGTFVNHQGHSYEVSYDIYVGNDNYSNFDIERNKQYNNTITIRGIESSSDQSNNDQAVSIDHRVNVSRTEPFIVNLRRETLLDAHFEVRPLRLIVNKTHTGKHPDFVKVEVLGYNETTGEVLTGENNCPDWIRLERSYGGGSEAGTLYCNGNGDLGASSAGKRKYFTYNLVSGKDANDREDMTNSLCVSGKSVEVPWSSINVTTSEVNPAGCVWIYVDECLEASRNINSVRSAIVRVSCSYTEGEGKNAPVKTIVKDYVVKQHRLFKVVYDNGTPTNTSDDRTYYIEHEEEYLHNFDADDTYGDNQTEFEGMAWGLYNRQLSTEHKALFFDADWSVVEDILSLIGISIDNIINGIAENAGLKPVYDFYVKKHDLSIPNQLEKNEYAGFNFTEKIVQKENIDILSLDRQPTSAVQYCYSRNKRNSDGTVTTSWYLPAIDELEDIMMGAYSDFIVFQDKFYWSSQPAFLCDYGFYDFHAQFEGVFYYDDIGVYDKDENNKNIKISVGRARATKVVYSSTASKPYDYARSGIGLDVYDNAHHIYKKSTFSYGYESKFYGSPYNNKQLYDWRSYDINNKSTWIDYDEGNKLRSDKCRVRAVVKKVGDNIDDIDD